jgi:hypothetical protein
MSDRLCRSRLRVIVPAFVAPDGWGQACQAASAGAGAGIAARLSCTACCAGSCCQMSCAPNRLHRALGCTAAARWLRSFSGQALLRAVTKAGARRGRGLWTGKRRLAFRLGGIGGLMRPRFGHDGHGVDEAVTGAGAGKGGEEHT